MLRLPRVSRVIWAELFQVLNVRSQCRWPMQVYLPDIFDRWISYIVNQRTDKLLLPHNLYSGAKHIPLSLQRPFHFIVLLAPFFIPTRQILLLVYNEQSIIDCCKQAIKQLLHPTTNLPSTFSDFIKTSQFHLNKSNFSSS